MAVRIIGEPHVGDAIDDFGYGPGAALLPTKQSTAPIGRIWKISILNVLVTVTDQLLRSPLADSETGYFHCRFR